MPNLLLISSKAPGLLHNKMQFMFDFERAHYLLLGSAREVVKAYDWRDRNAVFSHRSCTKQTLLTILMNINTTLDCQT